MANNEDKKTKADWLRDPATRHPLSRPRWTWSEADENWMAEEAKIQAQKIAKSIKSSGLKENTDELQRQALAELYKLTPHQSSSYSGSGDLFQHTDNLTLDDAEEAEFKKRYWEAKENERNNQPR